MSDYAIPSLYLHTRSLTRIDVLDGSSCFDEVSAMVGKRLDIRVRVENLPKSRQTVKLTIA